MYMTGTIFLSFMNQSTVLKLVSLLLDWAELRLKVAMQPLNEAIWARDLQVINMCRARSLDLLSGGSVVSPDVDALVRVKRCRLHCDECQMQPFPPGPWGVLEPVNWF